MPQKKSVKMHVSGMSNAQRQKKKMSSQFLQYTKERAAKKKLAHSEKSMRLSDISFPSRFKLKRTNNSPQQLESVAKKRRQFELADSHIAGTANDDFEPPIIKLIDLYTELLLQDGICLKRSNNMYILQDINIEKCELYATKFVHIMVAPNEFSCDCSMSQILHRSRCVHEEVMHFKRDVISFREYNKSSTITSAITGMVFIKVVYTGIS